MNPGPMFDLYALWKLIPYVLAFVREQCLRTQSRSWPTTQAAILQNIQTGGSFAYQVNILYRYSAGDRQFFGSFSRRCLLQSSAGMFNHYAPGTEATVRFLIKQPGRSYLPLPLGWAGFLFTSIPVAGFALFIGMLAFAAVQNRWIETHDAIPEGEWQTLQAGSALVLELPGKPILSPPRLSPFDLRGAMPTVTTWAAWHANAYFCAEILTYPNPLEDPAEVFSRILQIIQSENPKRYIYGDDPLTLAGVTGREFKFTRPYTAMHVYVHGSRVYVFATDWYVDTDERRFFHSVRLEN